MTSVSPDSATAAPTVIQAMAVIALKRAGDPLERDVILLATADEETGG